tara:strand:- start:95243 stop:96196 length:954 start_codon:yes stop_codon:yes gene_type:complete
LGARALNLTEMNNKTKISIIIPTYNSEATLSRAIMSAINQSYENTEIIVIDDGSSDNTKELIKKYRHPIKYIYQVNSGVASARNNGVSAATGEYIAFLDADDLWNPSKLTHQFNAFTNHPQIALCTTKFTKYNHFDLDTTPNSPVNETTTKIISKFEKIFIDPYFGTPSIMMRKSLFLELGGFDTHYETAEDIDLWLRAAYGREVAVISPHNLTIVVDTKNSLSKRSDQITFSNNLKIIDAFCSQHHDFTRKNKRLIRTVKSTILTNWGSAELIDKQHKNARTLLLRSLAHHPSFRGAYLLFKAALCTLTHPRVEPV